MQAPFRTWMSRKESIMDQIPADASISASASRVIEGATGQGVVDGSSQASCPTGWHAVGGGFRSQANNDRLKVVNSVPSPIDDNGVARGWRAEVVAPGGIFVTAYAICVPD
jgi:hypothetical protein